jgi:hypothetical protein
MIGKILASGQLGKLASFATPAFFDVMPARALWGRARSLLAHGRDSEAFRHAVANRSTELTQAGLEIELAPVGPPATAQHAPPASDPQWRAARVATLYFHQLFRGQSVLLDLRASAFRPNATRLRWQPAAWVCEFAEDFITPLREIYRGFYMAHDAQFHAGLAALGLEHSADLFRAHFGGDQARVSFRTADFIGTFHEVFLRCKAHGSSLHPDFLPLGIYLAALYDHLEELAVPVDVAAAFTRGCAESGPRAETLHV